MVVCIAQSIDERSISKTAAAATQYERLNGFILVPLLNKQRNESPSRCPSGLEEKEKNLRYVLTSSVVEELHCICP
ncbi:hypothetical protein TNCV_944711 [Trichonephila clavipes]|nr:hypothetical protein TNCV_944711 [Trichonephila clavipes]